MTTRIISMILAVIMIFSLAIPAFGEEGDYTTEPVSEEFNDYVSDSVLPEPQESSYEQIMPDDLALEVPEEPASDEGEQLFEEPVSEDTSPVDKEETEDSSNSEILSFDESVADEIPVEELTAGENIQESPIQTAEELPAIQSTAPVHTLLREAIAAYLAGTGEKSYFLYSSETIEENLTIPEGFEVLAGNEAVLTIGDNAALTVEGKLTVIQDSGASVKNYGTILVTDTGNCEIPDGALIGNAVCFDDQYGLEEEENLEVSPKEPVSYQVQGRSYRIETKNYDFSDLLPDTDSSQPQDQGGAIYSSSSVMTFQSSEAADYVEPESDKDAAVYSFLKEKIREAADGEISSTVFEFPLTRINQDMGNGNISEADLNLSGPVFYLDGDTYKVDDIILAEAVEKITSANVPDFDAVYPSLVADSADALYWSDKTVCVDGPEIGVSGEVTEDGCDATFTLTPASVTYSFGVAQEYQGSKNMLAAGDSAVVASGTCGNNLTWELDEEGCLTISGTGAMEEYGEYSHSAPWYTESLNPYQDIKKVVIEEGVTSIGSGAFSFCWSIANVEIPNSVSSIGDSAFYQCKKLDMVTIPDSVIDIGVHVFEECEALTSVFIGSGLSTPDITGMETSGAVIRTMASNFIDCPNLTSIQVSENNAVYASVDGILYNKDRTKLVRVPEGFSGFYSIPIGVKSIGMFSFNQCRNLKGVSIPDSVDTIGSFVFQCCDSLTDITIPASVNDSGMVISYLFPECKNLTNVTILGSVRFIGQNMFGNCKSLKNITLPASVCYIMQNAFYGCNNLEDVYYAGSQAQWEKITVEPGNDPLSNAAIHCNGEGGIESWPIRIDSAMSHGNVKIFGASGEEITSAKEGQVITLQVTPDDGYLVSDVEVENSKTAKSVVVTYDGHGVYHFTMPDSEVTVYAVFVSESMDNIGYSFTIDFEKNSTKATGTMKQLTGKVTAQNTLTANAFKWTGHTFTGWNTEADGTGERYSDKSLISNIITKNGQKLTLYAQWKGAVYTVTYDSNGGSAAPASQTKAHGASLTLSSQTLTRPGYTFKGWATSQKSANSGTVNFKPGSVYKKDADVTLYASWSPKTYKVIYDGNGVTKGATELNATVTFGKAFTMKNSGFTKNGYVLKGWSFEKHPAAIQYNSFVDYGSGEKLTAEQCAVFIASQNYSDTIRLYAVWGPVEYKITYKCNPATADEHLDNPNSTLYNAIEGIRFSAPVSTGHDFIGFYSDSKCTNKISGYPAGTTGAKTVYLKFEPHKYTIRFSAENGTFKKPMADLSCKVGTAVTLPASTIESPAGYIFSGWEYDNGNSCVTLKDKQKVKDLSYIDGSVIELKAVYKPITYSITLNANGGKFSDGKASMTLSATKYDANVTLPDASKLKEWSGYTLAGWNGKADCTSTDLDFKADATVNNLVSKNGGKITLYAVWEYNITLDGNGGKLENGEGTKTLTLKYNNTALLEAEGFTKEGASFNGWAATKAKADADKPTILKSLKNQTPGTTLYASWKATKSKINVQLYRNADNEDNMFYFAGNLTSMSYLPKISDIGWGNEGRFKSWNTKRDGTGIDYPDGASLSQVATNSGETINLYAFYLLYPEGYHVNANGATGDTLVNIALSYLGAARYDGSDFNSRTGFGTTVSFDCSGFVYRVMRDAGLTTPIAYDGYDKQKIAPDGNYYITSDTGHQRDFGWNISKEVDAYKQSGSLDGFKNGDLLFFGYYGSTTTNHVGMFIKHIVYNGIAYDNVIINSADSNGVVITPLSQSGWPDGILGNSLIAASRMIK